MDVSSAMRIVILGKTGVGKSSLANTIFGEDVFKIDHTFSSGTKKCQAETRSVNGRSITLIDTPGFFDTDTSEEELKPEIVRCITECAPGPHAFLIVLKVEKFTEQEQAVINKIQDCFSEEAFKYAEVVFTHGDKLPDGQTIEEFIHQNESTRNLVMKCRGRCHVVDNKYWGKNPKPEYRANQFQVEEMLKTIHEMVMDSNGSCYTNEMLKAVQKEIQQEVESIRKQSGNMSEEEITKRAKDKVHKKLLIRLAGVGTGALLGAFLSAFVVGGVVVIGLSKILGMMELREKVLAGGAALLGAAGIEMGGNTAGGGTAKGGRAAVEGGKTAAEGGEAAVGEGKATAETTAKEGETAAEEGEAAAGTVAVSGGTAAGTVAVSGGTAAAGTALTVLRTSAAAGAVIGGVTGFIAAETADTPQEAAMNAALAVSGGAAMFLDAANNVMEKVVTTVKGGNKKQSKLKPS